MASAELAPKNLFRTCVRLSLSTTIFWSRDHGFGRLVGCYVLSRLFHCPIATFQGVAMDEDDLCTPRRSPSSRQDRAKDNAQTRRVKWRGCKSDPNRSGSVLFQPLCIFHPCPSKTGSTEPSPTLMISTTCCAPQTQGFA